MDIREKMRRDWDRRAEVDPRYWVSATAEADESSYNDSAERDTRAFVDGLRDRVPPTARVLDLGCGIGRMTAPLAARFAEVVGVDVSPAMIEEAKRLHVGLPNLRFAVNSGADLAELPAAGFDLVCAYSVLPHLPPDVVRSYFHEVNRVLSPGGWFRYQFWVGPERRQAENDTLNIRVYGSEDFARLNREAGFEVIEVDEIDYFDPVLELRPVWVNARKIEAVGPAAVTLGEGDEALGDEERELEYGLLVYLAVKHAERGERDEAERVLEQAVACDPARPEAYVQWATHRLERDDLRGAQTLFEALTERQPGLAIGWLYRAQTSLGLDRFEDARAALDRFDALGEGDAELLAEAATLRGLLPGATAGARVGARTGATGGRRRTVKRAKKKPPSR